MLPPNYPARDRHQYTRKRIGITLHGLFVMCALLTEASTRWELSKRARKLAELRAYMHTRAHRAHLPSLFRTAQALMHDSEHNNSHLKSLPENRLQPYQNTSLLRVSCSIPVLPISASPFSRPHASELFDIEISQRSRGARHDDLFDPSSS